MRAAVTGTPGTGKTTATERLDTDLEVVHLNEVIRDRDLSTDTDTERDSLVADLDAIEAAFVDHENVLFESHLAHHLPVDRVIVLRCAPETIEDRLLDRGEAPASARENAESEALDVVLSEAVAIHDLESVYEVDTTDRSPAAVADELAAILDGEREPSAGTVDYTDYL